MEDSVTIADLRDKFLEAEDLTYAARKEAERARDYWDGKQLTDAEVATLQKRGQPIVITNRIRRKIQWLRGLEIKQRSDPKAFPRTPQDEQSAEAATDALRYVADNADFDRTRSMVWGDMLIEGFGGVEVVHKQNKRGEVDIVVNRYSWDRLFYDPFSSQHDFSDARYLGAVIWQDRAEMLRQHPGAKGKVAALQSQAQLDDTYDDKPRQGMWYDSKRDRVRVVLMWHREGDVWKYCYFCDTEKLDGGDSPYTDEDGDSVCPLILQSLYVGRNNDRYGVIRDMFSPQDEINKRRSKALHLLTMRQVRVAPHVTDRATISRELAKADGVIEADKDDFEILPTGDMASGQAQLLQEAKGEIDLLGANSALEGETGESTSGRAVLARQQGGMIEVAPEFDELRFFTQRVYEAFWDRIKQFWTGEKWVRITDDDRNVRFAALNRQVTFGEKLGQMPPEQAMQIARQIMLVPNDPRLQQVVEVEADVTETMVDIIIEEAPDRVTLAGEIFEALSKYGPTLPPQVLIEADPSLPPSKKEKLLELLGQQQQQQAQMAQPQQEAALQGVQAKAAKDQAQAMKAAAEAQQLPIARTLAAGV